MRWSATRIACGVWLATSLAIVPTYSLAASNLLERHAWLKLRIEQGRIRTTAPPGQCLSVCDERLGQTERLAVDYKSGPLQLRYERKTSEGRIIFQVNGSTCCQIQWESSVGIGPLYFEQVPGQPVRVRLYENGSEKHYQATGIWHLLSIYPDVRQELVRCLEQLRPDWQLAYKLQQLEEQLQKRWPEVRIEDVRQCVARLGDSRYAVRNAADRQLRQMGLEILPLLDQIDDQTLGCEQRFRIARIRNSLLPLTEDTPDQVASWLLVDEGYWQARSLASHGSEREWVRAHLNLLRGDSASPSFPRVARHVQP
ncbi:MAG: hypothetical protein KatS3mg110_1023 [Pirellulaceae bacterium]|nr:MAG: hypothetical protein KatS3mg110_1023 [Pirellulaceae bacterium]